MPKVMGKHFSYSDKGKKAAKAYMKGLLSVGKATGMYGGKEAAKMSKKYSKRTKVDKKK